MKVLLISVNSQISHGGIALWTKGYLQRCAKHNLDVDLVNTEVTGARLNNLTAGRNLFDEINRTKRIFKDLKKALKNGKYTYEVVHLNTSCGTFGLIRDAICAKIIKKQNIPLVTHYHCDIPYWIKKSYSKKALKKLASLSDENIVLCENSKKYLNDTFGISSKIVPNFVHESLVISNPKTINDDLKRVAFVGRVSRAKGALEIYGLAKRFPQITFELIGEVSEEFSKAQKPENVVLSGAMPHNDLIGRIDLADLFVFPSHSEGFSLALAEAMARGLPCVASDVGANKDMIEDKGGIIVPARDTDAICDAVEKLADKDIRKLMSEWNVNKVKSSYLLDCVMEKLCDIYSKI